MSENYKWLTLYEVVAKFPLSVEMSFILLVICVYKPFELSMICVYKVVKSLFKSLYNWFMFEEFVLIIASISLISCYIATISLLF